MPLPDDPDDHSVAVVLDGVVIGTVSLELADGMGQPGMPRRTQAHLGYIFDPAYAGRGYATEAVAAVVTHAVDTLGVRRVTAGCFADNHASVRILEKVGFRREEYGVGDSWHAELGWLDGCSYALLARVLGAPGLSAQRSRRTQRPQVAGRAPPPVG